MSRIVTCEICGKVYNQSYLGSHQRLAHGERRTSPRSAKDEPAALDTIVSMYAQLPDKAKKKVRDRLATEKP